MKENSNITVELFLKLVSKLKEEYKYSYSAIARKMQIPPDKIFNLRKGGSSVDDAFVHQIIRSYPAELSSYAKELGIEVPEALEPEKTLVQELKEQIGKVEKELAEQKVLIKMLFRLQQTGASDEEIKKFIEENKDKILGE